MMTKDEALRGLTIGDCRTRREAVKTVKELLNREECEDAISRQAVLNKIKKVCFSREQEWVDFRVSQGSNGQRDLIINFIEDLSPVNPQNCDKCEVGNPCLYCKHEFEERSGKE